MTEALTADLFGYVASILIMVMSFPQLVKVLSGQVSGVSWGTWTTICVGCVAWLVHGIQVDSAPLIIGNVVSVATSLTVVLAITAAKRGSRYSTMLPTALVLLLIWAGLLLVLPTVAASGIAIALTISSRYPQTAASLTSLRFGIATSVSRATWLLVTAGQSAWLVYGLLVSDVAVIVVNAACICATLVIVVAETVNSKRLRELSPSQLVLATGTT